MDVIMTKKTIGLLNFWWFFPFLGFFQQNELFALEYTRNRHSNYIYLFVDSIIQFNFLYRRTGSDIFD